MRRRVRGHFSSQPVGRKWAHFTRRGTASGNDHWGPQVQGLSGAAGGVAQALLPVSNVRKASALVTGKSACATTPPIRAPALDADGKSAPYTGPDDEPQMKANYAHVCYPSRTSRVPRSQRARKGAKLKGAAERFQYSGRA